MYRRLPIAIVSLTGTDEIGYFKHLIIWAFKGATRSAPRESWQLRPQLACAGGLA